MGKLLGFGRRNLNFEDHWEELDIENYNSNGVVLLCFGGSQTVSPATATRFCATAERFVGLKLGNDQSSYKHVDLLGFYYPLKDKINGEFNSFQRELIAENIFIKKCFNEHGELLPIESVSKNFSLINVISHCWGAREISSIGSMVEARMKKLGYTTEEIQFAFNQIMHVSYAPYTDHSSFPWLRVNSFQDGYFKEIENLYIDAYRTKLNGIDIRLDKPGFLRNSPSFFLKVPTLSVYTSQLINTPDNSNPNALWDEHFIGMLERNPDWTPGYQQQGAKNADLVSKISSYVLADSIAISIQNSMNDKLIPKTDLKELEQIAKSFCEDYSQEDLKTSF